MALVLDVVPIGTLTNNCYVTLAEALTYCDSVTYGADFVSLDNNSQNQLLNMATKRLDFETYYGEKQNIGQKLKFPRVGITDTGYLDNVLVDGVIPNQIKEATIELALYLRTTDMNTPKVDTSAISEARVGTIFVKYAVDKNDNISKDSDTLPNYVKSLLDGFSSTASRSGSSGGVAYVSR